MRNLLPITTVTAAVAMLLGCQPVGGEDYASVLPDDRLLINMPVEADASARTGEWSEFYLFTARVTDDVNGLIGGVLGTVWWVTQNVDPTWSSEEENTAVWGPFADALDPVETTLWVQHDVETDIYSWGVNQRPKNSDDEETWTTTIAGQVDAGATREASSGMFAIDFDAAQELDPNVRASGAFVTEYVIDPDGVAAQAAFDDFAEGGETVDALYVYSQEHDGPGAMDLGILADMHGGGSDEMLILRSRWESNGEGRSDAAVTGGDLGETVGTASECWDDDFKTVYYADNFGGGEEGDVDDCVYTEAEYPDAE